jgi:hypothetical protein
LQQRPPKRGGAKAKVTEASDKVDSKNKSQQTLRLKKLEVYDHINGQVGNKKQW